MKKFSNRLPNIRDRAVRGHTEVYYWVRGGEFNRPVIVRANCGVNSELVDGSRQFRGELNFQFGCGYPDHIWASDLPKWPMLSSLEWAGPIDRPRN